MEPTIPNRPPDRVYRFSLDEEPPGPEEFVRLLEDAGFVFDTTASPIVLRQPKEALIIESEGVAEYRQWDPS